MVCIFPAAPPLFPDFSLILNTDNQDSLENLDLKKLGIIGSGSWATALAKILTDNDQSIHWWIRQEDTIRHLQQRHHNKHYLNSVYFNIDQLQLSSNLSTVVAACDVLILAVPSAFITQVLETLPSSAFKDKWVVSAIKGIIPEHNLLMNEYLEKQFQLPPTDYFAITGPCHAEEIAAEKLSYLTFSGTEANLTKWIAEKFATSYLQTVVNQDVQGVQYAAVLKNIYALGAGIAHGLEYGDNFLSVFITNCFKEMQVFLETLESKSTHPQTHNYNASAYLGDLLVTCYSLYSRNRTFGNMIGKGYSVRSAQLELNMVAEGYYAARSIWEINREVGAQLPIGQAIYNILWNHHPAAETFLALERLLV